MSPTENHSAAATLEAMEERFGGGVAGAIALHVVIAGLLVVAGLYTSTRRNNEWGDSTASVSAIQASLVNAIPGPPKPVPEEKSVLASENETPTPAPPPKEKTAPIPKDTDILIKAKTPEKPPKKVAQTETPEPPKHPQPVAPTTKATTGDASSALPQSAMQLKDGPATMTVESRTFGLRYSYYLRIVSTKVTQNYYQEDIDPRSSTGKSATVVFDILRDGTVANLKIETRSGSESLDSAALHAVQRTDGFGPLPEGDHLTIEYKFDYHQR